MLLFDLLNDFGRVVKLCGTYGIKILSRGWKITSFYLLLNVVNASAQLPWARLHQRGSKIPSTTSLLEHVFNFTKLHGLALLQQRLSKIPSALLRPHKDPLWLPLRLPKDHIENPLEEQQISLTQSEDTRCDKITWHTITVTKTVCAALSDHTCHGRTNLRRNPT